MSFFDRFKKKDETPKKKDETPKKKDEPKDEPKDLNIKEEKDEAPWAASREKPVEEENAEESKMAEGKKKTADKPAAAKKSDTKVWHITKRTEDDKWQVKAEGATKATKLFKTKAEAEEYVKTLVSNNEGSRVVKHKKTGEFQNK